MLPHLLAANLQSETLQGYMQEPDMLKLWVAMGAKAVQRIAMTRALVLPPGRLTGLHLQEHQAHLRAFARAGPTQNEDNLEVRPAVRNASP